MSRELERRLAALERATLPDRARYTVSDRPPEDEDGPEERRPVMTEAEWINAYGEAEQPLSSAPR